MDIRIGMDMSNGSAYGKLFMIPQDPNDREFLLAVDRRARFEINRITSEIKPKKLSLECQNREDIFLLNLLKKFHHEHKY